MFRDTRLAHLPDRVRAATVKRMVPANTQRVRPNHAGIVVPPSQFRMRQSSCVTATRKKNIAPITKIIPLNRVLATESPAGKMPMACRKNPATTQQTATTMTTFVAVFRALRTCNSRILALGQPPVRLILTSPARISAHARLETPRPCRWCLSNPRRSYAARRTGPHFRPCFPCGPPPCRPRD